VKVSCLQLNSGSDPDRNYEKVKNLLVQAASERPDVLVLPEYTNFMGRIEDFPLQAARRGGRWFSLFSAFAREHRIEVVAGLLIQLSADKAINTACHFDTDGKQVHEYQKMHLFDIEHSRNVSFRESLHLAPGDRPVTGTVAGCTAGFAICYDLRFPELFRYLTLQGAKVIFLPSAFTAVTGAAHWEVLLRARAIENQVFIAAANQVGSYLKNKASYGHSLITDPWGDVLASAGGSETGEGLVTATLDFSRQQEIRKQVPCLTHIRGTCHFPVTEPPEPA
jgi:predicted amidohydrolase